MEALYMSASGLTTGESDCLHTVPHPGFHYKVTGGGIKINK